MFIGFAIVLDMLDGRVARMTGTSSAFGVEFDSLADVVSFGMAPAVLCFAWGLKAFDQAGWAATLRVRLGRGDPAGALQHPDQRPGDGQALLRRHAEPGRRRRARGDGLRVSQLRRRLALQPAGAADGAGAGLPDGQHRPVSQLQVDRHGHPALVSRPAAHGAGHRRDRHAPADHAGRGRLRLPGVRPDRVDVGTAGSPRPGRRRRRPTLAAESGAALGDRRRTRRRFTLESPADAGRRFSRE